MTLITAYPTRINHLITSFTHNMICKYQHKGTWEESLSVFLFSKLINDEVDTNLLKTTAYNSFELSDATINRYNQWFGGDRKGLDIIRLWLAENADGVKDFKAHFKSKYKAKVELWSDRNKTTYYKNKLQKAFEFENFIAVTLKQKYSIDIEFFLTPEGQYGLGENKLGIEIKNDTLIKKYGNIYIEYAEKSKASNYAFVRSGILKDDNTKYFLIGEAERFYIFRKKRLLEIYSEERQNVEERKPSPRGIKFKKTKTSMGFVFPVQNAKRELISIETMVNELKKGKE